MTFRNPITSLSASQITPGVLPPGVILPAGQVSAGTLALEVIARALANGTVTPASIAAGAVTSGAIAADAVTSAALAAGSVLSTAIATGAVTSGALATAAVTAGALAGGSVTGAAISAGAVTATALAANAVVAGKIAAGAVTAGAIAAGAVTAGTIAAGVVTTTMLAAGAVVASTVAAGAIGTSQLAAGAVAAGNIAAGAITTAKLAAGAITGQTITGGTITGALIETAATGQRVVITTSALGIGIPELQLFTGDSQETLPGAVYSDIQPGGTTSKDQGFVGIAAPTLNSYSGGIAAQFFGVSRDGTVPAFAQIAGVMGITGEPWKAAPAFANSWHNYGGTQRTAGYRKMLDGTVMLRGLIAGGAPQLAVFVLPAGYRPGVEETWVCWSFTGVAQVIVQTSGNVLVWAYSSGGNNTFVSLAGIRFSCID